MDTKLIALVDGSIYSKSVCDHAAWLAGRTKASIEVIHVLGRREIRSDDLSGSIALGARSALLADLSALDEQRAKLSKQKGRAILEDAEVVLRQDSVETVTTRLMTGDILETLHDVENDAAMIVIGKRGEAADFAKLHVGSNLERVVRASRKPVFVASRAFRQIEKVLVAFDGGASSIKAVDYLSDNAAFKGLAIHLLTVGQDDSIARGKLEHAKAKLETAGLAVSCDVRDGQAEAVIAQVVEDQGYDLLAMGAYGHSRVRNLLIGSTTTEMIRSCKVPVLLFR